MEASSSEVLIWSFLTGVLQVTLWDLVKEGSLEQLTVVLNSLKDQVSWLVM